MLARARRIEKCEPAPELIASECYVTQDLAWRWLLHKLAAMSLGSSRNWMGDSLARYAASRSAHCCLRAETSAHAPISRREFASKGGRRNGELVSSGDPGFPPNINALRPHLCLFTCQFILMHFSWLVDIFHSEELRKIRSRAAHSDTRPSSWCGLLIVSGETITEVSSLTSSPQHSCLVCHQDMADQNLFKH
jgi:hypothetical protein